MKKNNRTNSLMYVEFEYEGTKEEVSIWIPFPIFVDAIRETFSDNLIKLDGTDNSIWNMFVDLGIIDEFEDNEEFIKHCQELYKHSKYRDEDYEEWVEELKFMQEQGE